jgi:hypothetical protein
MASSAALTVSSGALRKLPLADPAEVVRRLEQAEQRRRLLVGPAWASK